MGMVENLGGVFLVVKGNLNLWPGKNDPLGIFVFILALLSNYLMSRLWFGIGLNCRKVAVL